MYRLKSLLALIVLSLFVPLRSVADEQWCAVTDNNHIITLSSISYLASTAGETKFNVVLNDGTAIEEVESMVFAIFHVDALEDVQLGTTTELAFYGDKIVISGAPYGSQVTISTLDGRNLIKSAIESESQPLDISALTPSVYILNVGGKSVKFRKL